MSDIYKLETWKTIFNSWKLLIPATIVAFALWLLPGRWIKDVAVVALRDQYRGHFGFAAIALATISGLKAIYETKNIVQWFLRRRKNKAEETARRQKVFRKLELLGQAERDLLQSCADRNDPILQFPKNDPRINAISRLGIWNVVEYDPDFPNVVFRVQPWFLEGLRKRQ